jgi:hypothetical protein
MTNVDVVNTVTTRPTLPAYPFAETGSPQITVPAGRHLVVETLSIQVDVSPSDTKIEAFVNYTSGGNNVTLFVPLTYAYTNPSNDFAFYTALQAVRLYADPGSSMSVTTSSPAHSGTLFITVSGYLV